MYHYKTSALDVDSWTIKERNRRVTSLNKQLDAEREEVEKASKEPKSPPRNRRFNPKSKVF